MIEGDFYPHLRHIQMETTHVDLRTWDNQTHLRLTGCELDRYEIHSLRVPAVQVTLPVQDWEEIMEIYRTHWHAQHHNPSVRAAWEQYRMLLALAV